MCLFDGQKGLRLSCDATSLFGGWLAYAARHEPPPPKPSFTAPIIGHHINNPLILHISI